MGSISEAVGAAVVVEETDKEAAGTDDSTSTSTVERSFTTEFTMLTQALTTTKTSNVHIAWGCVITINTSGETIEVRLKRDTTELDSQTVTGTGTTALTHVFREYDDSSLSSGSYSYTLTAESSQAVTTASVGYPNLHLVAVST